MNYERYFINKMQFLLKSFPLKNNFFFPVYWIRQTLWFIFSKLISNIGERKVFSSKLLMESIFYVLYNFSSVMMKCITFFNTRSHFSTQQFSRLVINISWTSTLRNVVSLSYFIQECKIFKRYSLPTFLTWTLNKNWFLKRI